MRLDPSPVTVRITLLLAVFAAVAALTLAQPPAAADTIDLTGTWMFRADWNEDGLAQGWQQPGVDESQWRAITVPGRWEDQNVTKPNPLWPSKNEQDGYNGYAWYRRKVAVPAEWNTGRIAIHIAGIDGRDWTYVNGTQVGSSTNESDIDGPRTYLIPPEVIKPGQDNLIAIRVCDAGGFGGITAAPVELVRDGEPIGGEVGAEAPPQPADTDRFYDIHSDEIKICGGVEVGYNTKVEGDAVAVGGSVKVLGWVTGDAVAFGGNLIIGPEGRIDGEAVTVGGTIERQPGAYVGGQQVHVGGISGDLLRRLISESFGFAYTPPVRRGYDFWSRFVFFLVPGVLVSVVAVLLFPKRMAVMASSLPLNPGRVAITGVVGMILAPGAAIAILIVGSITAVVSAITLVGPVVVLGALGAVYVLWAAAVAMGCAAVWLSLGKAVLDRSGRTQVHPLVAALAGAVILSVAGALPAVGVLVPLTVLVFGFGLALMTGIGKHEDWLSRRPYRLLRRRRPEVEQETAAAPPEAPTTPTEAPTEPQPPTPPPSEPTESPPDAGDGI